MTTVDLDALDNLRAEMLRTLCVDHGHAQQRGGMDCRTCKRRAEALLTGPLANLIADARRYRELREAVERLTYASDDCSEWDHNPRCSGEAECPACWAQSILAALAAVAAQ